MSKVTGRELGIALCEALGIEMGVPIYELDGVQFVMPFAQRPTEEGKRHWPPTGFYDGYPCTCTEDCTDPCKGGCGCEACNIAYNDYLSGPA